MISGFDFRCDRTYSKGCKQPEVGPGGDSTLKRSRSLAAPPRADLFSSLGLPPPRAQLIPRARLVDKSAFRERQYIPHRPRSRSIPIPRSEPDSLDSNSQNKSSVDVAQVSPVGLSLPNYYPRSVSDSLSLCSLSLPAYTCDLDYESSLSDLEPRYYESDTFNPIFSEPDYQSVSDSCSELNNFDEITVRCKKIEEQFNIDSKTSTLKPDYKDEFIEEINKKLDEKIIEIKIENLQEENIFKSSPEDHITLITIDDTPKKSKSPTIKNFLSKAFEKRPKSSLANNQFHSLPDINAKNLQKCEKIDRKLRDKLSRTKSNDSIKDTNKKNRFIVNIGQHFNIPNINADIPVDFEVKISKVPKIQKTSKSYSFSGRNTSIVSIGQSKFSTITKQTKEKILASFRKDKKPLPKITEDIEKQNEDVKTIRNYTKIEDRPEQKYNSCSELDSLEYETYKSLPNFSDSLNSEKMNEHSSNSSSPVQEYQEKLGTMRCFWDRMISKATEDDQKQNTPDETQQINKSESPPPKETIAKFENLKEQSIKPEPCKIVDVQSKVENVRKIFENGDALPPISSPGLVETNRKIFEKIDDKMNFVKDTCGFFENPYFDRYNSSSSYTSDSSNQFESLNPNVVEIVEKVDKKPKQTTLIKSKSFDQGPEFDHVRYKVMKSDLFQKNIFANYEKELQFDGLMQYLQDYSFQELLVDNNIVIIEPIRTKVEFSEPKKEKSITKIIPKPAATENITNLKPSLRRHFFYHPIRVNREVNDSELPNPDTVKQVRQFFESTGIMKKSQSHNEIDHPSKKKTIIYQTVITPIQDPDRDRCSESSEKEEEQLDSIQIDDKNCCQYVSEDVLQKIRECGTCTTYYGGKVLEENNNKHNLMTKVIMEEIKGIQRRNEECFCKKNDSNKEENCKIIEDKITFKTDKNNKETYQGIKFKLIKSNSCSSRLELVGTENVTDYRKKFLERQKSLIEEQNLKNLQNGFKELQEIQESDKMTKENEKEKQETGKTDESPKVVAEEKKLNLKQWKNEPLSHFIDYKDYAKLKKRATVPDIEFESYEVVE